MEVASGKIALLSREFAKGCERSFESRPGPTHTDVISDDLACSVFKVLPRQAIGTRNFEFGFIANRICGIPIDLRERIACGSNAVDGSFTGDMSEHCRAGY